MNVKVSVIIYGNLPERFIPETADIDSSDFRSPKDFSKGPHKCTIYLIALLLLLLLT